MVKVLIASPASQRANIAPCRRSGAFSPEAGYKARQLTDLCRKRIAFVRKIEFEPLLRKYHRARRPASPACKSDRRAFTQEDAAGSALRFAGDPKPGLVAADEEGRDRRTASAAACCMRWLTKASSMMRHADSMVLSCSRGCILRQTALKVIAAMMASLRIQRASCADSAIGIRDGSLSHGIRNA
jgi:hypothetical protein